MTQLLRRSAPQAQSLGRGAKMDGGGGPTVLVVDDDDLYRESVVAILRAEGFASVEAPNGKAAIDYLVTAPTTPSLILLDMNMPVMSGLEMMGILGSYLRFATIPIVVVTGERRSGGLSHKSVIARLSKPFHFDDLIALVRRHTMAPGAPLG